MKDLTSFCQLSDIRLYLRLMALDKEKNTQKIENKKAFRIQNKLNFKLLNGQQFQHKVWQVKTDRS